MRAPPYYAVIFVSTKRVLDAKEARDYDTTAARMVELARTMPGFLGIDSTRGDEGVGITVSYWESEEAIQAWKAHGEHAAAREQGRRDWYASFSLHVAKVERAYRFER